MMPESESTTESSASEENKPVAYLVFTDSRVPKYHEQINLFVKQIFRIGRHDQSNTFVIPADHDKWVSRNHCEIYVVEYESGIHHIYARDRGSSNRTLVNDVLIDATPGMASGYLLQDGDVVQVLPYWRFTLNQPDSPPAQDLTKIQSEECKVFADMYTLTTRCLGKGAEATVYLATETATKKQLVCKLVNLDTIKGRSVIEESRRRRQEMDILRQLHHVWPSSSNTSEANLDEPNILPYVDAISSPHTLYTFTDLAAGGDLMSFVYRHEEISEFDTQIIIRQVVNGLEYLHQKGIVHRDLKPENILLANSPKLAYTRIMLSDFGASAVPRRNRMITNVGTTRYQAPREFYSREQQRGPAVDIWSLGIVVLFLVAPLSERDPGDLSMMKQQELELTLKNDFFGDARHLSELSKSFMWQCLRVQATDRLTAAQAAHHEWLQSSPAHVKFFQKFDRKVRASWHERVELNAMPWEIPSVSRSLRSQSSHTKDGEQSSHFKATYVTSLTAEQANEPGDMESPSTATMEPFVFQKPSIPSRASVPKPLEVQTPKPGKATWKYGERARRRQFKRKRMSELNISPDVRIHDGMDLPLNNLNRHLPPRPNTKKRRQVLEELKQSKAMFLPR